MGTSPSRVSRDRLDRHLVAGQLAADLGRLAQREAALAAAADVDRAAVPALGVEQLALDEVDEVLDVEQVADLLALAAEPDVGERAPEMVGQEPVGEDALVDLAHLPGPGEHAAAVDHRRDALARAVLLDQQLGGELGRAVEGPVSDHRELLGDTRRRGARNLLAVGELEPGLLLDPGEGELRLDRVDPAGREEDEEGAVAPGELEAVVGAGQVGVDEVGGVAVGPAHHRGLGRALDQGRDLGQAVEVGGLADVAADELDAGLLEPRQVQLRAAAVEVVEGEDLPLGVPRGKGNGRDSSRRNRPRR